MMYDTLGAKFDSLTEADLLDELGKIATVKTGTEVQAEDHCAMENPVEPTLAMDNITKMVINLPITEQFYQYPFSISEENLIQNQPAPAKRSTADMTTHKFYNEGYDNEDYTEKVDAPKITANTSPGSVDPQRATPYFIEDGTTPDWSESLKLSKVVVPSVSNITEPDLSTSTTAMMAERWGRPSNTPMPRRRWQCMTILTRTSALR
jgi:hypothetical protein